MRRFLPVSMLVIVLAGVVPQAMAQSGTRIVTRTRLQVVFSDLENRWIKAIQQKDTAALDGMLADEFEVWTPSPPGNPMPREDWQAQVFARKPESFRIEQMSVRGVTPSIAVANFRLTETFGQGEAAQTETHFVVDVWVTSGRTENWKCTDRYMSRVVEDTQAGAKRDVKPTGKE